MATGYALHVEDAEFDWPLTNDLFEEPHNDHPEIPRDEGLVTQGHTLRPSHEYWSEVMELSDGCIIRSPQTDGLFVVWQNHLDAIHLRDEELSAQLKMLPSPGEVSTVVSQLEIDDLRDFAGSIMNVAVNAAQEGHADLNTIRLLNGWFASMEETIAAADELEEIMSRRWKPRSSGNR
jgi:hypothetical protein